MYRRSFLQLLLVLALVLDPRVLQFCRGEEAAGGAAEVVVDETEGETGEDAEMPPPVETAESIVEAVEGAVEDVVESVTETVVEVEESASSALSGLKEKLDKLVDKVKSVDQATLKKAAIGAVGVWGVSVAVGWLANSGSASAPSVTTPEKRRR